MHEPADEPALVAFWNENSGWGTIEPEAWRKKFMDTPLGDSSFALAIEPDSNRIMAQFGFIPSTVSMYGEDISAYRPVAIMLHKELRKTSALRSVPRVIVPLYNFATKKLGAEGVNLVHMVPDHRWAPLFRFIPAFEVVTLPVFSLPLPLSTLPTPDPAYKLSDLSYDDPAIDELWAKARHNYPFMVARNGPALRWKNSHRKFKLWGLHRQGELVGLFSTFIKDSNRKWQICDMLSIDTGPTAKALLEIACLEGQKAWQQMPESERTLREVEFFSPLNLVSTVASLGFQKIKYKFSMVVHRLNKELPAEISKPENWYVSPNE